MKLERLIILPPKMNSLSYMIDFEKNVSLDAHVAGEVKLSNMNQVIEPISKNIPFFFVYGKDPSSCRIYPDHALGFTRKNILLKLSVFLGDETISAIEVHEEGWLMIPILARKKFRQRSMFNISRLYSCMR